jgi:hypothetical protein
MYPHTFGFYLVMGWQRFRRFLPWVEMTRSGEMTRANEMAETVGMAETVKW